MRAKLLLLCCLLVLAAGCIKDGPPAIRLSDQTRVEEPLGLIIWVDGLDMGLLNSLREAGRLPNISRYFIDGGVTVRNAVASLPTVTYANNISFITGMLPGHHDIVGNKWFDRNRLIAQDYGHVASYRQVGGDFSCPTIFERLATDQTVAILTPGYRGATRNIDNWATAGISWYFDLQDLVNRLTTARFELITKISNQSGRWPKLVLAYFVAPDTVGHHTGPTSPQNIEMILSIDRQVGYICTALQRAGLLERTCVTLVTDHGFVETPRHWDVITHFQKELGVATLHHRFGRNKTLEKRITHFGPARAVVQADGTRHCAIHLRCGDHWWQRPSVEEIDGFLSGGWRAHVTAPPQTLPALLCDQPAVELVVVRLGSDGIRIQSCQGLAIGERVVRDGKKLYSYKLIDGTDPLGYASNPASAALMGGACHDAQTWLAATLEGQKPDVLVQLIELNDSPRSGDISLYARDGWDFGIGKNRGGHGGLLRHEIIVPWFFAGPGLPAGTSISNARTVNLMPTMLQLIGRAEAIGPGLDGWSIADRLRQAKADGPASAPAR